MEQLKKIFEEEIKIYQEILKLSKDKTDIVKENRVSELETITRSEEELIANVIELEKKRIAKVKDICRQYGKEEKSLKIDELCEFVTEGKEELQSFKIEITKILKELKKVNNLNDALIRNNLEYINFAVSIATGAQKSNTIYEQKGKSNVKGYNNILDIKL